MRRYRVVGGTMSEGSRIMSGFGIPRAGETCEYFGIHPKCLRNGDNENCSEYEARQKALVFGTVAFSEVAARAATVVEGERKTWEQRWGCKNYTLFRIQRGLA